MITGSKACELASYVEFMSVILSGERGYFMDCEISLRKWHQGDVKLDNFLYGGLFQD